MDCGNGGVRAWGFGFGAKRLYNSYIPVVIGNFSERGPRKDLWDTFGSEEDSKRSFLKRFLQIYPK